MIGLKSSVLEHDVRADNIMGDLLLRRFLMRICVLMRISNISSEYPSISNCGICLCNASYPLLSYAV